VETEERRPRWPAARHRRRPDAVSSVRSTARCTSCHRRF